MKRIIVTLIVVVMLCVPVGMLADDCTTSKMQGEQDGLENHNGSNAFLGGLAGGVCLGLIGTGIACLVANSSSPSPEYINDSVLDESCYVSGYHKGARKKNVSNALTGGLVGTAVIVVIYVVMVNRAIDQTNEEYSYY